MTMPTCWTASQHNVEIQYVRHERTAMLGRFKLDVHWEEPNRNGVIPEFSWSVQFHPAGGHVPTAHSIGIGFVYAHTLEEAQIACVEAAQLFRQILDIIERTQKPPEDP